MDFLKNFIPIQDDDGYNPFLVAAKKSVGVVKVLAEDDRTEVNVQVRFLLCLSLCKNEISFGRTMTVVLLLYTVPWSEILET